MRVLWAFLRRDFLIQTSYRFAFAMNLLAPFPQLLMFFFVAKLVDGSADASIAPYAGGYFSFVLLGVSLQRYLNISLSSFSSSLRESQLSGTLESMFAAPLRLPLFLFGSTLYSFWFNALRIFLWLAVGGLLFGAELDWARLPLALPAILLTIVAFSCLGILTASYTMVFKRGDPVGTFIPMASYLLGGVYFPVSLLPGWLQKVALLVPTTASLEALRGVLLRPEAGAAETAAAGDPVLPLLVWTAVGLPLSLICFRLAFDRARARGALGHY